MVGPVEQGGEIVKNTIDALKASPALLSLLVTQVITIAVLGFWMHERNAYEMSVNAQFQSIISECLQQKMSLSPNKNEHWQTENADTVPNADTSGQSAGPH